MAVAVTVQKGVHGMVTMSVIMLFDLILVAAVVPIVRQVEGNKDKILKVCSYICRNAVDVLLF